MNQTLFKSPQKKFFKSLNEYTADSHLMRWFHSLEQPTALILTNVTIRIFHTREGKTLNSNKVPFCVCKRKKVNEKLSLKTQEKYKASITLSSLAVWVRMIWSEPTEGKWRSEGIRNPQPLPYRLRSNLFVIASLPPLLPSFLPFLLPFSFSYLFPSIFPPSIPKYMLWVFQVVNFF